MDAAAVQQMLQSALQQQQQALHQQMNAAIAAAVAAAANAAPAAAPVAAAPSAARTARLPPPALFEGASAKLDEFIADIEQQVAWYTLPAGDVVRFAGGFMRGAARDWHTSLAPQPADWPSLVLALRSRFQPVNSAESARAKLLALSQGKQSVNDYIDAFRRLLVRVPTMSGDDRFHQFRRGLRPAIALQIDMQGITTLDAAITRAAQIGGRLEIAQAASSSSSGGSSAPMELDNIEGLEGDTSATNDADAPVTQSQLKLLLAAMQDNRRGGRGAGAGGSSSGGGNNRHHGGRSYGLPRMPHLSEDQVKEYMAAGKCFGCGATDHTSRGCPKRKKGPDGRVSWSN
jgi:uncharacterized membrane protein YgcG